MRPRQVLVATAVFVIVALAFLAGMSTSRTVTTTITSVTSNSSDIAVKEVILQPEVFNDVCIIQLGSQTTTFLFHEGGGNQTATVLTETLTALNTFTVYNNATIFYNGSTCTEINAHYDTTQTQTMYCPPCA